MKSLEVPLSPAVPPAPTRLASARLAVEVRNASVICQAETDAPVHALSDIREGELV